MNHLSAQHNGYGLEINCSSIGVNVLWSDGSLSWFSNDLQQEKNYQVNGLRSCGSADPNIAFSVGGDSVICSIDCRQPQANRLTKPSCRLSETAIASFDCGLAVSYGQLVKTYDIRTMKPVCIINEAHCDDIVDVGFWRGLLVTASQDNLCCVIDYTKGNEGIIETINAEKPLGLLGILSEQYLSVVSDDNAFILFNGETRSVELKFEDLRTITSIGDESASTILKGCFIDNQVNVSTAFTSGKLLISAWLGGNVFSIKNESHLHSALVRDYEVFGDCVYSTGEDGKIFVYKINQQPNQHLNLQPTTNQNVENSLRERAGRRSTRMSED